MSSADKRAKKALDSIARDKDAWDAMLGILYAREVRDSVVRCRLEAGLTQAEVARRMDISQSSVAEFETCRYPDPRLSTLRRYYMAVGKLQTYSIEPTLEQLKKEAGEASRDGERTGIPSDGD